MSSLSFLVFLSSSSVEARFYFYNEKNTFDNLLYTWKITPAVNLNFRFTVWKGAFSVSGTSAIENWQIFPTWPCIICYETNRQIEIRSGVT